MRESLLGQMIGERYRLCRALGKGGMGQVFEAMDTHLFERRVAVKVLHHNLSGAEMVRRRFQAEARISALLGEHPLIVRVTDYGVHYDQPYIVMEYLGAPPFVGQALNELLEQGPIEVKRVIRLGRQICSALQYAHSFQANQPDFTISGVIHRDIKPGNIFILRDQTMGETIKVLDFGIAKTITDMTMTLGTQMAFIGTPSYASPEQMRGEPLDARADLYSLGVVFYEMLSGETPLVPKTQTFPGWYEAHNYQQPKPLDPQQVPPPIAEVVMQCLEKEPDRRPANMAQLRERLKAALQNSITFLNRQATAAPKAPDPEFLKLIRPLEVSLAEYEVSPQFRLRDAELHVLLEFRPGTRLERASLLNGIASTVLRYTLPGLERVIVYGRPFKQPSPDWQETLHLAEWQARLNQAPAEPVPTIPPSPRPEYPRSDRPEFNTSIPSPPPPTSAAPTALAEEDEEMAIAAIRPLQEELLNELDPQTAPETDVYALEPEPEMTVDLVDRPSQISSGEQSLTQFGRMQRRAFLSSLPTLSEQMTQVREWSMTDPEALNQTIFSLEMKRSIIDLDPEVMLSYQAGKSALFEGDLDHTIDQMRRALELDAELVEARVYLGNAYARQGDIEAAMQEYQTAIRADATLAEAHAYLGGLYLQEKQLDPAIECFQEAISQNSFLTETHIYLLKALIQKGYVAEAIQQYIDTLQSTPQLLSIRDQMAQTILLHAYFLLQNGEAADAVFYLRKAMTLNTRDATLHCFLGMALLASKQKRDWQDALTEFRIATRLDSQLAEAFIGLGIAQAKLDNLKGAIHSYRTALGFNSNRIAARYNLAMTLYRQGELQQAIAEYRAVLELDPGFAEGYVSLGFALLQAGEIAGATQAFNSALTQQEANLAEAHWGRGTALMIKGDLTEAIKSYRRALDLYPMLGGAHAGIGLVYLKQAQSEQKGELEAAKEKFDQALRIDSSVPEAHFGLGEIERLQGSRTAALQHYKAALQGNRSYTEAHLQLGLTLMEEGNRDEALREIRFVLDLDPNQTEARALLEEWTSDRS